MPLISSTGSMIACKWLFGPQAWPQEPGVFVLQDDVDPNQHNRSRTRIAVHVAACAAASSAEGQWSR